MKNENWKTMNKQEQEVMNNPFKFFKGLRTDSNSEYYRYRVIHGLSDKEAREMIDEVEK